jgi:hypothetical protein
MQKRRLLVTSTNTIPISDVFIRAFGSLLVPPDEPQAHRQQTPLQTTRKYE